MKDQLGFKDFKDCLKVAKVCLKYIESVLDPSLDVYSISMKTLTFASRPAQ